MNRHLSLKHSINLIMCNTSRYKFTEGNQLDIKNLIVLIQYSLFLSRVARDFDFLHTVDILGKTHHPEAVSQ